MLAAGEKIFLTKLCDRISKSPPHITRLLLNRQTSFFKDIEKSMLFHVFQRLTKHAFHAVIKPCIDIPILQGSLIRKRHERFFNRVQRLHFLCR